MKKQISKISVHQSSKVMALLYFVLTLIVALPMGLYMLMMGAGIEGALIVFTAPFIYMILGYLGMALVALIYNLVACKFGGIEVSGKEIEE